MKGSLMFNKKNVLLSKVASSILLIIILQTITYSVVADNPLYIRIGGPYHGEVDEPIQFYLDIQGGVLPYNIGWNFGDGNTSTKQFPTHIYKEAGIYTVSVTVSDGEGTSKKKYTNAYVYEPLLADAGGPYSGYMGDLIVFSGNVTGGVFPYTYNWDLDNDQKFNDAEGKTISKMWEAAGTYTIALQVKDYFGNTNIDITLVTVKVENSKPNKPSKPSGETSGKTGEEYTYTTITNDPDGDQIWYKWSWSDETSGWLGPFDSGDTCEAIHTWDEKGEYEIKVKAKDQHGEESPWSDPLHVSMTKSKAMQTPSLKFLQQHPLIYQLLQRFLRL